MIIPVIVKSHHHVLRTWFDIRRQLGSAPDVISFDSHTDTIQAFLRWNSKAEKNKGVSQNLIERVKQGDETALKMAIGRLRNDEFIDFAVQADLIRNAYVFSWASGATEGDNVSITQWQSDASGTGKRIFVFSPNRMPCCGKPYTYTKELSMCTQGCRRQLADLAIDDDVLKYVIEVFQQFGFEFSNYILDFDCDFFLTKRSLSPESDDVIGALMRMAMGITIAQELDFVRECRIDKALTASIIVSALKGLIEKHNQSTCGQ
mgnify:CR=1 FL=1